MMFRYEAAHLAEHWGRYVDFQKFDVRSDKWRSVDCPDKIATAYLQRKGRRNLRPLRAVISTPTLRPDGSILDQPGYDAETALFYDPCGLKYPTVPDSPSPNRRWPLSLGSKNRSACFLTSPMIQQSRNGQQAGR